MGSFDQSGLTAADEPRLGGDPPGDEALQAARAEVERYTAAAQPPQPRVAYAVGGSARRSSASSVHGSGATSLPKRAVHLVHSGLRDRTRVRDRPGRTRTLAASAVILSALQERLDTRLRVVRGGLRDGAISELEARALAA